MYEPTYASRACDRFIRQNRTITIDAEAGNLIYNKLEIFNIINPEIFTNDNITSGYIDDKNNLICTVGVGKNKNQQDYGLVMKTKYWYEIVATLGKEKAESTDIQISNIDSYNILSYYGQLILNKTINISFNLYSSENKPILAPEIYSISYEKQYTGDYEGQVRYFDNSVTKFTDKHQYDELIQNIIDNGTIHQLRSN